MTVAFIALAMAGVAVLAAKTPLVRSPLDRHGDPQASVSVWERVPRHSTHRTKFPMRRPMVGRARGTPRDPADALAGHIELVAASLAAGLTTREALEVASAIGDATEGLSTDVIASACAGALVDHGRGLSLATSLRRAFREVDGKDLPVDSYLSILIAQDRDGLAVAGDLDELAASVVERRRQERAQRARRLPVTMLFPLVTCVLPAFALLTIVPVVLDSIVGLG